MQPNSTMTDRIRAAIAESGMTQAEIARRCHVSPQAVTRWRNGFMSRTKIAVFCKVVGVNVDWLVTGKGDPKGPLQDGSKQFREVPLLSIDQVPRHRVALSAWASGEESFMTVIIEDDGHAGPGAFGLRVPGAAMAPDFRDGDIVIIDPDARPIPGSYVLVEVDGEILLRRLRMLTSKTYEATATNTDWAPIRIDDLSDVVGVAVEHRRRL